MSANAELVSTLIDARQVRTLFQPIVHLPTSEIVGYEALARGPVGSAVESPIDLIAGAKAAGRLAEFDWVCAASACEAALAARLHPSMSIFLNFEPATLLTECPEDLLGVTRIAQDRLRVFIEVKEESLLEDPGRLFEARRRAKETNWGIAIDNAVATPASLALLPLLHPDVIKIDLRAMRGDASKVAEASEAVRLYAEQTGATVLMESLEDPEDVAVARALGATYGEGWHFGAPGKLPTEPSVPRAVFPLLSPPPSGEPGSPFEIIAASCPTSTIEKRFLSPLSTYLEEQVDANGPPGLLLVSRQYDQPTNDAFRARLESLAHRSAYCFALGREFATLEIANAQGHDLFPGGPISMEWNVIVLGPHYAVALTAKGLGGGGADRFRRFEYAMTHDRDLVVEAARGFLSHATSGA